MWCVDIEDKKHVLVHTSEYQNASSGNEWAPDSKWIVYGKSPKGTNSVIYLYSLDQKKSSAVTDGFFNSYNPAFDGNGKYLYFLSQRYFFPSGSTYEPRFGYHNTNGIFALTLKADEASPFVPESDEEKADEKKPPEKKDDAKNDDAKKNKSKS